MAQSQRDVRERIGSVKNIQKITRAMEMVAAARLRRAEQRIEHLRPYAYRLSPRVPRATRLPIQRPTSLEREAAEEGPEEGPRAPVASAADPEEILPRLVPDYVAISIYRAPLESTASEHGARRTAMRTA